MVFGFLLMIAPIAGALVIAIWIGAYALVFGVLLIALGFRLRSWSRHVIGRGPLPAPRTLESRESHSLKKEEASGCTRFHTTEE